MLKLGSILVASVTMSSMAFATGTSHKINIAPVRGFIAKQVDKTSSSLRLTTPLSSSSAGVSKVAAAKAAQTLVGLTHFNTGDKGGNFTLPMGKSTLVITQVTTPQFNAADPQTRFVARSGGKGLVVARGNIKDGTITWTRMHNEHASTTPAEVNAAK